MANYTEIESLDILIRAVKEYLEELQENHRVLVDAANVCDVAMGSDAIVQKHLARLNAALPELDKAARITSNLLESLIAERQQAVQILEEA